MDILDILRQARLSNILQQSPEQAVNSGVTSQDPVNPQLEQPVFQGQAIPPPPIARYYEPQTRAIEALGDTAIDQMPLRADYKDPGFWTKLRAHLAGMGSNDPTSTIDTIEHKKYYQDLNEWNNKLKALGLAAGTEQRYNTNERMFGQAAQKGEIDQQRVDISKQRADAYEADKRFKMEHPTWQKLDVKGGNRIYFNPQNPDEHIDTGIPTGTLSDEEMIGQKVQGQKELIGARGVESRKTEQVKGDEARKTKSIPSGTTAGTKAETSAAARTRLYNRAQQAINEHPEWSEYIKLEPSGRFYIKPPSKGWWSGKEDSKERELHDAIYSYIYSGEVPNTEKQTVTNAKTDISNRVYVVDINTGKPIGTIDAKDAGKLDTKKYKVGGPVK